VGRFFYEEQQHSLTLLNFGESSIKPFNLCFIFDFRFEHMIQGIRRSKN